MNSQDNVVVIGAGVGGLTTAAILAKAGYDVTVLEAHVYAGGCAGTFYHQGYRFDAGATLAGGFYPGGPMDIVAQTAGVEQWPLHHSDLAMKVHLPNGLAVERWGDEEKRKAAYDDAFGPASETFWRWQESTADLLWSLALRSVPWPPQSLLDSVQLVKEGSGWLLANIAKLRPNLLQDAFSTVDRHLSTAQSSLRQFVDAQLLIAAQTTSSHANALYGAAALDLPRRGVVHLKGGIGAIADTLVSTIRKHGGEVRFRQEVSQIQTLPDGTYKLTTKRGETYYARSIAANLPPWNIAALFEEKDLPRRLQRLPPLPSDGWGAVMLYCGFDPAKMPKGVELSEPLHHQVVVQEPMGEGNTVFVSLSPEWDNGRVPSGMRAATISTHTSLAPWWQLHKHDRNRYEIRRQAYADRLLEAAERALPGLRSAAELILPGTPVTFQRFTRRQQGWVGGFPQTNLWRAWGPRLDDNLWMVGDSIFPGQSTAAVALGGMRVAASIQRRQALRRTSKQQYATLTSKASTID